jgi:long-chain acyl-CoA synthetase
MKDTLIDSFLETVASYPKKEALIYKSGHHFASLNYEQLYTYSQRLATYMKELGVGEGDRVMLVSENRPEWVIVDLASLILGAILVPVHSVLAASQMAMIVEEIEPKIIFVSDKEMLAKTLEVELVAKSEGFIGYFDTDLEPDNPLMESGKVFYVKEKIYDETYLSTLEPVKHKSERVITIIYTSGTTGRFKGVELTNLNIISNIQGLIELLDVNTNDRFLSVLPLSHVFERTLGYYLPMVLGATISYVLDPSKLAEMAEKERPTIILGVPRLYEKVYQAIHDKANKNFVTKILFATAFKAASLYFSSFVCSFASVLILPMHSFCLFMSRSRMRPRDHASLLSLFLSRSLSRIN